MYRFDDLGVRPKHQTLDDVPELAHVAGPRVCPKGVKRLSRDAGPRDLVLRGEDLDVIVHEEIDVGAPFVQRRHFQVQHVQPVEQVLAELARRHGLHEVAVCGRDDTDVGAAAVRGSSHRLYLAGLEEPQQERLHAKAHFAHFIKENSAAVSLAQEPGIVAIRPGEAASHMTEELGFQQ